MIRILAIALLILMAPLGAWAAVELDADSNGATDIGKGGTNATTAAGARTSLGVAAALGADDNYVTDAEKTRIGELESTDSPGFAGMSFGVASTTTGLVSFYGNAKAFPFGLYSQGADAPAVGWRLPSTMPAAASVVSVDANGYLSYLPSTEIVASGFDGNLATTDDTVQEIAQKLDDLSTSGAEDVAYDVTTWDADTGAPSKNVIRDYLYNFDADGDGDFTDETWFPSTSGAPTSASYFTATSEAGLSAESNLGALTTGLLKITVAAGVATPSTAVAGTDYQLPLPDGTAENQLLQWNGSAWVATSTLSGIGNITGAGSYNNITITQPATGATLTLVEGSTLATSGAYSLTLTTTGASVPTFPVGTYTLLGDADVDDTPVNGVTTAPVSSNWAFDHAAQATSDTVVGHVEAATTAETNTGTSTSLAVTPDGLSGSIYGQKEIGWFVTASDTATAVADGKQAAVVPASMNGMNLIDLTCSVHDLNSAASGDTTVVVRRVRGASAVDMTSTGVTIAYTDYTASDETVDTSNDDLETGDKLYVDVNAITTAAQKGLSCTAMFQTP